MHIFINFLKKPHLIAIFWILIALLLHLYHCDGFQLTSSPSSLSPTRRPKTTRPTRRSATKPTSRRKRRLPPSRPRTALISPCLQWRPSSINSGPNSHPAPSPPPGQGRRIGTSVLHYHRWRYAHTHTHSVLLFTNYEVTGWWVEGGVSKHQRLRLILRLSQPRPLLLPQPPFTCWALLRLLLPTTVNQTPVLSQCGPLGTEKNLPLPKYSPLVGPCGRMNCAEAGLKPEPIKL